MQEEKIPGIDAKPCGTDLFKWHASISGPEGSPYEGGKFEVEVKLPQKYPLEPPQVKFRTPIFHPNINHGGEICLDVLKHHWSPALTLQKVLLSISSLLTDPNFADPLDATAASLYRRDRKSYDARCREMTRRYAGGAGGPGSAEATAEEKHGTKRPRARSPDAIASGSASHAASPAGRTARAKSEAKAKAKAKASPSSGSAKAKAEAKPRAKAKARVAAAGEGH